MHMQAKQVMQQHAAMVTKPMDTSIDTNYTNVDSAHQADLFTRKLFK
jgi:hypothetical protein